MHRTDNLVRTLTVVVAVDFLIALPVRIGSLLRVLSGEWQWWDLLAVLGLVWLVVLLAVLMQTRRNLGSLFGLLSTQKGQLDAVEATSHEWLWQTDADLVVTTCSPAVSHLLGYRADELVGRSFLELVDERDRLLTQTILDEAVRTRTGWADVALRWRRADGQVIVLQGTALPILNAKGAVTGFRGARRLASADEQETRRLQALTDRVKCLLADQSLAVALQPIVNLSVSKWAGVEALARFPDGRPPDLWFADADAAGLGSDLELLAIEVALRHFDELPAPVYLSINASPACIMDPRFSALLTRRRLPLDRLVVEITEHAAVAEYQDIRDVLGPLRERGLRLAVDDTGAGYASFQHVLRLRPDIIKLDRSLVTNIHADPARRALVTSIGLLALELGATITAEGIESVAEARTVIELGVDTAQGYFIARPTTDSATWLRWRNHTWSFEISAASTAEVKAW